MLDADYFPSLKELNTTLTEDDCLEIIWRRRYGKRPECLDCDNGRFYRLSTRKAYVCKCGYQVSPTRNTIFHKSTLPLTKWFEAIRLIYVSDGSIPALEIARKLRVTYKTAWRVKHLICGYLQMKKTHSYKYSSAPKPRPPIRRSTKNVLQ